MVVLNCWEQVTLLIAAGAKSIVVSKDETEVSRGGGGRVDVAEYIGGAISGAVLAAGFIVIAANYLGLI